MANYKTILVALDGSENSDRALQWAIELAVRYGSTLVLAHVLDMQYFSTTWLETPDLEEVKDPEPAPGTGVHYRTIADYQRAYSREVIEAAREKVPKEVPYRIAFEVGSPRKDVLKMIKTFKADLVVLGNRGLGRFTGMVLGSVSDYVVHHSPVAVLVVR